MARHSALHMPALQGAWSRLAYLDAVFLLEAWHTPPNYTPLVELRTHLSQTTQLGGACGQKTQARLVEY